MGWRREGSTGLRGTEKAGKLSSQLWHTYGTVHESVDTGEAQLEHQPLVVRRNQREQPAFLALRVIADETANSRPVDRRILEIEDHDSRS